MSKTIKERARKYATQRVGGEYIGGFKGDTWLSLYQTYIEIATEQRKIDIEIFLEVLDRCRDICSEREINLSSLLIMSELAKLTKEEEK